MADFDNQLHPEFLAASHRLVSASPALQMVLFSQARPGWVLLPFQPEPYHIDTAQMLVHSNATSSFDFVWHCVSECEFPMAPDGVYIQKAFKVLCAREGAVLMVNRVLCFHNRLKWD